jgi:hypothetical protein
MLSLRNFEKSPAIYSISVDSRSRPPGEPVNKYHINLNANIQRVRTVQLGSIYIPAQAIQAIGDTLNNNIAFMEPLQIGGGPGTLVFQETMTVCVDGNSTTTTFPPVTITLPPTLNPIVSVGNGSPNPVVTTVDHGLLAGTLEWGNAGLHIYVVGGLYPASPSTSALGPEVSIGTIQVTGGNTFTFNTGYLSSLAADPQDVRNTVAGQYVSFIYAEPPTLSELLMMLNHWLSVINDPNNLSPTGATLINPVQFALDDSKNSFSLSAGVYTRKSGNTVTTVTTKLLNTGSLNAVLGITGTVPLIREPRFFPLSNMPAFHMALLNHGTFLQGELETMVSCKMSPLDFTGLTIADRTFHWGDSGGVDRALVILEGRYTGDQLASHLQELMQAVAGLNYAVVFNAGKFTFSSTVNAIIGLNFLLGASSMASKLGFQYQNYSGGSSYMAPFSIGTVFPVTTFQLIGDSVSQRFTLVSKSVPTVVSDNIVGSYNQWNTLTALGNPFVPGGFYSNQVIQATVQGGPLSGQVLSLVLGTEWSGSGTPFVTVLDTASFLAVNGIGQPSAGVNVYLRPAHRFVTQFLFGTPQSASELLGFTKQTLPVNTSLGQVMNADEPNVYYLPGPVSMFGIGAASSFTGPFLYNLLGPDYILMRILNDCDSNTSNEHSYLENSWNILAKMYLRPNYQHISEEMLHVAFAGMKRISSLYVEFLNPDGSLVDFNGRDHTYSLLFTAEIKFAANICM